MSIGKTSLKRVAEGKEEMPLAPVAPAEEAVKEVAPEEAKPLKTAPAPEKAAEVEAVEKTPAEKKAEENVAPELIGQAVAAAPAPKKRGRKPGSKNKPKASVPAKETLPGEPKKRGRKPGSKNRVQEAPVAYAENPSVRLGDEMPVWLL